MTLKKKVYYNFFQKKLSPKVILCKKDHTCQSLNLIPPNKIKPSKKCLKAEICSSLHNTERFSSIWLLVNTLIQTCSTVPFSSVQHREEGKSQQVEEKTTPVILLSFIKIPRQLKLCGWVNCQGCLSVGRHERKLP